jgi:hypothetical protein
VETKSSPVFLEESVNVSKMDCLLLEAPPAAAVLATQILGKVFEIFLSEILCA